MTEFIASRDLSPEDFEKFSEQHRRSFNHHRSTLNEYRQKSEGYAAMAQSSLRSLNRDKAHAMKHGVDLEPKKLRFVFLIGMFEPRDTVMIRAPDLETAKMRAREALDLRAERRDEEPPVAWTLQLSTINGVRL